MNNRNKAFTLIELLAVIIILGVLLLLAVPNISKSVNKSKSNVYITNAKEMLKAAHSKINDIDIPVMPTEENAVIIPISTLTFESSSDSSPFGQYEQEKCYIIVTKEDGEYIYYINLSDTSGRSLINIKEEDLSVDMINTTSSDEIYPLSEITGTSVFQTNYFSYKYVSKTNGIIKVQLVYDAYRRGRVVTLKDNTSWVVLTHDDSEANSMIKLISTKGFSTTGEQNDGMNISVVRFLNREYNHYLSVIQETLIKNGVKWGKSQISLPVMLDFCPTYTRGQYSNCYPSDGYSFDNRNVYFSEIVETAYGNKIAFITGVTTSWASNTAEEIDDFLGTVTTKAGLHAVLYTYKSNIKTE